MANFNLADYETVDSRIHKFYEKYPMGRIVTHLLETRANEVGQIIQYVFKAEAFRDVNDTIAAATGYAEEMVGSNPVNKTSPLENCETSAIGRCLANLGFSPKGSRPSQTEMTKAERTKPAAKPAVQDHRQEVFAKIKHLKFVDNDIVPFMLMAGGVTEIEDLDYVNLNNMPKQWWLAQVDKYVGKDV